MAEFNPITPSNFRRTNWDVMWNTTKLGAVDVVTPDIKLLLDPVQCGSTGKIKLDDRFVGLEPGATIKIVLREVTRVNLALLCPWGAGGTVAFDITPANNAMIAQYAQKLTLHPRDKAGTTEDIEIYKAVPVQTVNLKRDGLSDDAWEVTFNIYPDLTKLAAGTNPWGQVLAGA